MRILRPGLKVSQLCIGCEALGGTDWGQVSIRSIGDALSRALELGINFFDVADVYGLGLAEERLAAILGSKRHEVVIATKGGVAWFQAKDQLLAEQARANTRIDLSVAYIRTAVENSLKRLKLEQIPLYYIHWPAELEAIQAVFSLLASLQSEGKIGHIGCSNFNEAQLAAALSVARVAVVQQPINYIVGKLSDQFIELCAANQVLIVGYNVLYSGLLTGKYDESSQFSENDRRHRLAGFKPEERARILAKVADMKANHTHHSYQHPQPYPHSALHSLSQKAIAWVLQHPRILAAITGVKSVAQLEENAAVLGNESKIASQVQEFS